jgi:hypothetical protein
MGRGAGDPLWVVLSGPGAGVMLRFLLFRGSALPLSYFADIFYEFFQVRMRLHPLTAARRAKFDRIEAFL